MIIAIIPARGNSKRIKNKNIKKFNNKSLLENTITTALKSKYINKTFVTSDSNKILNIAKKYRTITIQRPKNLSGNIIMPDYAILHILKNINYKIDYVVMLQPTSPLLKTKDVDKAIEQIIKDRSDSLLSCFKTHAFIWKKYKNTSAPTNYNFLKRPRSQETELYQENGAIYITRPEIYFKNKNRLGGKISIFTMDFWESLEIDEVKDFKIIEKIAKFKL